MNKAFLSLNFMHFMERFATQIYRTQRGSFKDKPAFQQLTDASDNEGTHVRKLRVCIAGLNSWVYPLGWLFQFVGLVVGLLTRLCGKRNLFRADVFVETRAVKDYNGFLKSIPFDSYTVDMIKGIIADEEVHIINWKQAMESLDTQKPLPA